MNKQELQTQQAQVASQLIATERQLKVLNEQYDAMANALTRISISEAAFKEELDAVVSPSEQKTPPTNRS